MIFDPVPSSADRESVRIEVKSNEDVVAVRKRVRELCRTVGLSLISTTKLVTAASELSRNTLEHGHGGWVSIGTVSERGRVGLRILFADEGPGIEDMDRAMTDGFTTGKGLGLGLSGSKRLVDDFSLDSEVGKGTRVRVTQWK